MTLIQDGRQIDHMDTDIMVKAHIISCKYTEEWWY